MAAVAAVPDKAHKAPTGRTQKAEALRKAAANSKESRAPAPQKVSR
jgi:hypothetical protein